MTDFGDSLIDAAFADNPEPRCPCILLLDTSSSMAGKRIQALNEGVKFFRDELDADPIARKRVEIAIVTFGADVRVAQDFVTVDEFATPILAADGLTPMGAGVLCALDQIELRKAKYRANGIQYYRPWIFMLSDGAPQGEPDYVVQKAINRVREAQEAKRLIFFAVGVEDANLTKLAEFSIRKPKKLKGLQFQELFLWLSNSLQSVSRSRPDEQVPLPGTDSWEFV
jgi:uncharacterized protein YegL